ncbi:MAG: 16S rRNA (guanine(966)-N(2))-methyltransferase RsmD [Gammaproteobacteria bacterium]|nr:16S rRNA (guanine(966)-N(2))-methyltransferase RsmD [Gammaproteobacteria bacterium]
MAQGQIRIISGMWRGRKLKVPDLPGLRPTTDQIRETVFNWLQTKIVGAHCLDLFTGSGALGFEALSRGAEQVVMIDQSPVVVANVREQLKLLKAFNAEVYQANVPQGLKPPVRLFDVVFLDPPFGKNLLLPCCFYLEENKYLANNAYIYLESENPIDETDLPSHWKLIKSKKTGQVAYHLAQRIIE